MALKFLNLVSVLPDGHLCSYFCAFYYQCRYLSIYNIANEASFLPLRGAIMNHLPPLALHAADRSVRLSNSVRLLLSLRWIDLLLGDAASRHLRPCDFHQVWRIHAVRPDIDLTPYGVRVYRHLTNNLSHAHVEAAGNW